MGARAGDVVLPFLRTFAPRGLCVECLEHMVPAGGGWPLDRGLERLRTEGYVHLSMRECLNCSRETLVWGAVTEPPDAPTR